MNRNDKALLESLTDKYGKKGVENAVKRLDEAKQEQLDLAWEIVKDDIGETDMLEAIHSLMDPSQVHMFLGYIIDDFGLKVKLPKN